MTAYGPICSLVLLVLACTSLQTEATKSMAEIYNALPASDQEALGQLVLSSPAFKRRSGADPNFLRFGKRAAGPELQLNGGREPNFLRFGKRADSVGNNFLRFGRSAFDTADLEAFERENRKPNFLRFG
ncbi:FMRFamide-like neuropeptide [Aphelenchoides bicaudatus]|nr:FMRFamide-like neuropeptide [Aphelenchoides bicaudatus]